MGLGTRRAAGERGTGLVSEGRSVNFLSLSFLACKTELMIPASEGCCIN